MASASDRMRTSRSKSALAGTPYAPLADALDAQLRRQPLSKSISEASTAAKLKAAHAHLSDAFSVSKTLRDRLGVWSSRDDELQAASAVEEACRSALIVARDEFQDACRSALESRKASIKTEWLHNLELIAEALHGLQASAEPDSEAAQALRLVCEGLEIYAGNAASIPLDIAPAVASTLASLVRHSAATAIHECGGLKWHQWSPSLPMWLGDELDYVSRLFKDDASLPPVSRAQWTDHRRKFRAPWG